jgi:hypothetical protein
VFEKFFTDPSFDFETRSLLGDIHYGAGDIGEMLTAVANISDGDATSWVQDGGRWPNVSRRLAMQVWQPGTGSVRVGRTYAPPCTMPRRMCSWMGPRTPTPS